MKNYRIKLKSVTIIILFLLVFSGLGLAQKSDEETLRYLKEIEWAKAYREQDTKLLDRILADEFQMIDNEGNWSNKKDEIEYISKNKPSYASFRFEIKRLEIFENGTAVVAGTGHITGKDNDGEYKVVYQSSNILIKRSGLWKAISSHVSGIKKTNLSASNRIETEANQNAELKKLEILVGTWKGTGWIMTQKGRQTSKMTEIFQYKLGGQIAVVDGLGISKDEKTGEERISHRAYGTFAYDKESGKIKFRYYKAETGEEGETLIQVVDNGFTWGFNVNETGSKVKFSMRINEKGNWHEIGEFSRDSGKTWMKFLEMELSKVAT